MRKIFLMILSISVILSMTACGIKIGKKKEAVEETPEEITYTEEEYNKLQTEYNNVRDALALYDDTYNQLSSFKKREVLQSGQIAFDAIKDKIVLNGKVVSGTESGLVSKGLEARINLGEDISIKADGWVVSTNTNEIYISKDNLAAGVIKLWTYTGDEFDADAVSAEKIKPFFENNDITARSRREIYLNTYKLGEEMTGDIYIVDNTSNRMTLSEIPILQLIDEDQISDWGLSVDSNVDITLNDISEDFTTKKENIRVGLANANGTWIYYEFIYSGTAGKSLIDLLIGNIFIKGNALYLK